MKLYGGNLFHTMPKIGANAPYGSVLKGNFIKDHFLRQSKQLGYTQ